MGAIRISRGSRRILTFLTLATIVSIVYRGLTAWESWLAVPLEKIGFGEEYPGNMADGLDSFLPGDGFRPGDVKPPGASYSKTLVVTRTKREDVSWITESFRDSNIETIIYVADDPWAPYHPPKNKGNEAMIYLTYIIDHYESLADVNIFMHSHRYAWHNDQLLDRDAVQMVNRLSPERVQREGYMNMRCDWLPGCPNWLDISATELNRNKKEEVEIAGIWPELFPGEPIPHVLAQSCCSQFAVSRDRIRALPKARYVHLRNWLMRTPLRDSISGRIWEYVWHFVFTGQTIYCPKEHVCYCDGYGICFGGETQYDAFWEILWNQRRYEDQLKDWHFRTDKIANAAEEGRVDEAKMIKVPEPGMDKELEGKIAELEAVLNAEKLKAMQLGNNPMNRAKEAGRAWKIGDGF